jgi:hypothetical protein
MREVVLLTKFAQERKGGNYSAYAFLPKKHVFMSSCLKNVFLSACKYRTKSKKLLQNKN